MAKHNKTTVFIVDDHEIVIKGIETFLESKTGYRIVGHATDGETAIEQIKSLEPDIVILDISMPGLSGIDIVLALREAGVSSKIVAYTMSSGKENILRMFNAGISGYVLKGEPLEDLMDALKSAESNSSYYAKIVEETIREHLRELELGHTDQGLANLSKREKEVLPLLADGKSIDEIADTLFISRKTVESHKYNIMEKLNVSSIADLTKLALKKKLIEI